MSNEKAMNEVGEAPIPKTVSEQTSDETVNEVPVPENSETLSPNEHFVPVIESTFDAMSKDFNEFRNSSLTNDVKNAYLKAITSLNNAKKDVLAAINLDLEARNISN